MTNCIKEHQIANGLLSFFVDSFIGVSRSEPHTSEKNGMSVAFANIYVERRLMVQVSCVHKSLRLKIG